MGRTEATYSAPHHALFQADEKRMRPSPPGVRPADGVPAARTGVDLVPATETIQCLYGDTPVGRALPSNFALRRTVGATLKLALRVLPTDARHGQNEFARGTREARAKPLSFARPPRGLL